ncbi:MAG: flavin reductase family protein [Nocardioidaceae bacterium]|nr:flavin reductase family protein [Nocardioidaceae bacterium]
MIDSDRFKQAMRRLAGGVNIVTSHDESGPLGITATAVTSLSCEPASVLCCINQSSALERAIRAEGTFGINVLRSEHVGLARRFAGMGGIAGAARFDVGLWERTSHRAPTLADSLVALQCELVEVVEAHTHSVFIGNIAEVLLGDSGEPLVYCDGSFSRLEAIA